MPYQHPRPTKASLILLVDDDALFRLITAEALRQAGYSVDPVEGGRAALDRILHRPYEAVVVDARMPDVDGFELCRQLRLMPQYEHLPVLMLTGHEDDESISRAYSAGATDFVIKSAHSTLLIGRLQHMLRAASTRTELERSKLRLARAQRLARMGSCSWTAGRPWPTDFSVSPEGLHVLGLPPQAPVSLKHVLHMVHPEDRRGLLRVVSESAQRVVPIRVDVRVSLAQGQRRVIHLDAEPEPSDNTDAVRYTAVIQDVTDRRTAEDRIRHLAEFDTLTALPNRHQILWRAERALEASMARGHQMALLLVDLDRFKLINDTLGHTVGDELLVEVAQRLRDCVRHVDHLFEGALQTEHPRSHRLFEAVGRLGGDEFIALLPEVASVDDAHRVAERMLETLRKPLVLAGQECFVTASIGLSIYPGDGDTVVDLMRHADIAMYAVKGDGRNAAIAYDPTLSQKARDRLELGNALYKALERGELRMRYQPTVDAARSRVVGAEALMRWERDGQLLLPAEFIPVAEESGLIVPMTEWALNDVAQQIRHWRDTLGFEMPVAVNMPARMLSRMSLVALIESVAAGAEIHPSLLRLEITETTLMEGVEQVVRVLAELRQLGVEISIDDFGTGYSSLVHFMRHPIGELKIDKDFIKGLGQETRSDGVVGAVIAMGRALDLRVVAEGVETATQFRSLSRMGCHRVQGLLFAPPLQPAEFAEYHLEMMRLPEAPWLTD